MSVCVCVCVVRRWYYLRGENANDVKLLKDQRKTAIIEEVSAEVFVGDQSSTFSRGASPRLAAREYATLIKCEEEGSPCLGFHGNGYLIP